MLMQQTRNFIGKYNDRLKGEYRQVIELDFGNTPYKMKGEYCKGTRRCLRVYI